MPCYTTLEQRDNENIAGRGDHGASDVTGNSDVVDVEVREIRKRKSIVALPSPAPVDAPANPDAEAALWERWHTMSRRQEKS